MKLDLLDSEERKRAPIVTGVMDYFPDALVEVAQLSVYGNDKHNPGEPLHWAKEKSTDHADCVGRHLLQRGTMDFSYGRDKPVRHSAALAWRALALLQTEIENERQESEASAARDALHDGAEAEYLADHGVSVQKRPGTELDFGGTHKSSWPYEADRSLTMSVNVSQKAWKPGIGG